MSEKHEIQPHDQIRLTRNDDGSWSFAWAPKGGGFVGKMSDQAATFDAAVAKIKERYRVD